MNTPEQMTALILIQAAGTMIYKRRELERMCGYPKDYGGDAMLLTRIDQFLSDSNIAVELRDAEAAFKTLLKEKK